MAFDWHSDEITGATVVDAGYKNTQNVRRFLVAQCGDEFKFTRDFMAWIRNSIRNDMHKTMADVARQWTHRQQA